MSSRLSLDCCVLGDARSFTVEIEAGKKVNLLKEAIKDTKKLAFSQVDANLLELWQVDIPVDERFEETLNRGVHH